MFVELQNIINESEEYAKTQKIIELANSLHTKQASSTRGGNPPKYKSSGITVYILYKNNNYKRTIYMKDKRN